MKMVTVWAGGKFLALQAALLVVIAMMVPLHASCTESRPELIYGNTVAGVEFVNSGMAQVLFHQSTLATTDNEALAVSFPSGGATPAIAQTSSGTAAAATTGLFISNFQFSPVVNLGAVPVGAGQFGVPQPVATARFSSHSLLFPEMTVEGNLRANGDFGKMIDTGISLPPSLAYNTYDKVRELAYLEQNKSAEGFSAGKQGLPVILSGHTVDFVSTPDEINNTSIVDRLWRNSHQANALNYMYEGEAARPVWIAPVEHPYELIDCGIASNACKDALEMTRPGKYLSRAYWTL